MRDSFPVRRSIRMSAVRLNPRREILAVNFRYHQGRRSRYRVGCDAAFPASIRVRCTDAQRVEAPDPFQIFAGHEIREWFGFPGLAPVAERGSEAVARVLIRIEPRFAGSHMNETMSRRLGDRWHRHDGTIPEQHLPAPYRVLAARLEQGDLLGEALRCGPVVTVEVGDDIGGRPLCCPVAQLSNRARAIRETVDSDACLAFVP